MEIIKLNLIPSGVNPTCHCSQYDKGRVIRIELFDGLTPYTLQSGDTVTLNVRKPDNTIVTGTVSTTQGNNYVDIVTTEQICACVGYNLCDLTLTNGSKVIGTLNFIMAIERDVLADGIPSQSVIEDLDALVQEAVGDNYYTKEETDEQIDDALKDVYPLGEASGAIASFNTGVILPLNSCVCEINPIQAGSGDPSPSNIRQISGFTGINVTNRGKNLINIAQMSNNIATISGDTITLVTTGNFQGSNRGYFNVEQGKSYRISWESITAGAGIEIRRHYANGDVINTITVTEPITITINDELTYKVSLIFGNRTSGAGTYKISKLQVENGSTTTVYEPCKQIYKTISWQTQAGTVYGGYINITTGELVVTRGYHEITGTENWAWAKSGTYSGGFYTPVASVGGKASTPFICTHAKTVLSISEYEWGTCFCDGSLNFRIMQASDTIEDWKTYLANQYANGSPVTICFTLATPITYQLDPVEIRTLLNENYIYHDCNGDIDVIYHKALTAKNIYFDNSGTELQADNVEDAIKEILTLIQGGNNSRALNLSKGSLKVEAPVSNEEPAIEEEPVKAEELTTEEEPEAISDNESEPISDEER